MSKHPLFSELAELLNRLEALISNGIRVPLTHRVMVDEDEFRTLLNQISHVLPEEVRQAQWIVQERERILVEAGEEAEAIRAQARQEASSLTGQSHVVQEAEARASEILAAARATADEIRRAGKVYLDEQLARVEKELTDILRVIAANRAELDQKRAP